MKSLFDTNIPVFQRFKKMWFNYRKKPFLYHKQTFLKNSNQIEIEYDYNDHMIFYLRSNGYNQTSDLDVIKQYIAECVAAADQENLLENPYDETENTPPFS